MAFDDLLGFHRGARLLGVRAEVDHPGWPVVRFTVLTLIQRCFRTSTLATERHQRRVYDNASQPRGKQRSPLERIQMHVRVDQTLLQRVLGIFLIAQQRECGAKKFGPVANEDRRKRIGISCERALNEPPFLGLPGSNQSPCPSVPISWAAPQFFLVRDGEPRFPAPARPKRAIVELQKSLLAISPYPHPPNQSRFRWPSQS